MSYKSTDDDKDSVSWGARFFAATVPVYSSKPVGVGDKWSQDYSGDAAMGTRDAHADYEILGEEKWTAWTRCGSK